MAEASPRFPHVILSKVTRSSRKRPGLFTYYSDKGFNRPFFFPLFPLFRLLRMWKTIGGEVFSGGFDTNLRVNKQKAACFTGQPLRHHLIYISAFPYFVLSVFIFFFLRFTRSCSVIAFGNLRYLNLDKRILIKETKALKEMVSGNSLSKNSNGTNFHQ